MTEFNKNTFKTSVDTASNPAGGAPVLEAAMAKKNFLPYVVFALLLVLIAGGVYYFSLKNSASLPTAPAPVAVTTPPTVTPTPTTPADGPVSVQDLQNAANSINISTDSADLTDLNKDIQGL